VGKVSQWTFEQAKVSQISFLSVPTKRLEVLQHEGCRTRQKQKEGGSALPEQNRVFRFNSAQGVPRKPSVLDVREGLRFR